VDSRVVEAHLPFTGEFQLQRIELRHERLVADGDQNTLEPSSECTVVTPHTLVHIPGASGYGLQVQRASLTYALSLCSLDSLLHESSSCRAHSDLTWNLEVQCTRCPVRRAARGMYYTG